MITFCRTIQLLEPQPAGDPLPIVPPIVGPPPLSVEEGGVVTLAMGVVIYQVNFLQEKLNANYDFIESDITIIPPNSYIPETPPPLVIEPSMLLRTVFGFQLNLDAEPDSPNFVYNFRVRVNTV